MISKQHETATEVGQASSLSIVEGGQPRWLSYLFCLLGFWPVIAAALPTLDLSSDTNRHVIIAQGTEAVYQGHATTLLLPDGKTIFCVWCMNHGGRSGPLKRSDDGGLTWSDLLPVPESWTKVGNCPSIYRLPDPQGKMRLFVFAVLELAGRPDGAMHFAVSEDDGKTWSDMKTAGLKSVMPFTTIVPIEGGKKLLGMTNIRPDGAATTGKKAAVAQSLSTDGGFTWSPLQIVCDTDGFAPCEPALVRSPNGKELLCLMRDENKGMKRTKSESLYMTSRDEGATWSAAKRLPAGLVGDRHMPRYAPDGRLVVCMRDKTTVFGTFGHFVAWVGRYEDIVNGREGQYRIKLLRSYKGYDCGYPGVELLPDGTFVATTYIKYRPGPEKNSVVSTRFKLSETDAMAEQAKK